MELGIWKVRVVKDPFAMSSKVYLYRKLPNGVEVITHEGVGKVVEPGTNSDNDYFALMDDEQLQALANGLTTVGIKTNNDHKNEGLLEAKDAHLQDMRKLVFRQSGETPDA